MPDYWKIHVRLRAGGKDLGSPRYQSEDEAKSDLQKISEAQKSGEHIDLPWLSVDGTEVLVAQIVGGMNPRGF